jgi:hypothetical protein
MPSGGRRAGAGRPPGTGWKPRPVDLRAMAAVNSTEIIGTPRDPLGFLLNIAADPDQDMQVRLSAASITLPFLYPKLSAATVQSHSTSIKVDAAALLDRLSERIGRLAPPQPETPLIEDNPDDAVAA